MTDKLTAHDRKQMKKEQKDRQREEQRNKALSANRRSSLITYGIIAGIVALVLVGVWALSKTTPGVSATYDSELLNINLQEHNNLALHIHPILEIELLGEKENVPANIGISAAGMKVVHTHDATGTIHIETPYPAQLYLRDFFTVWNETFNSTCIFDNCADDGHELKMTVNGEDSTEFENLSLRDKDIIRIVYQEKSQ